LFGAPVAHEDDPERAVRAAIQAVAPTLPKAAFVFLQRETSRAAETFDEALAVFQELPHLGWPAVEFHLLAWVALNLDRSEDVLAVIEREQFQSPWMQTARAVAAGDLQSAADIVGGIGAVSDEAFYRLRAAEQLVRDGRRAEADEQLRPALAFYRSVRATRYIREGEALLAASA
jgi:thioredoxin-like negative regulator of GroEL